MKFETKFSEWTLWTTKLLCRYIGQTEGTYTFVLLSKKRALAVVNCPRNTTSELKHCTFSETVSNKIVAIHCYLSYYHNFSKEGEMISYNQSANSNINFTLVSKYPIAFVQMMDFRNVEFDCEQFSLTGNDENLLDSPFLAVNYSSNNISFTITYTSSCSKSESRAFTEFAFALYFSRRARASVEDSKFKKVDLFFIFVFCFYRFLQTHEEEYSKRLNLAYK
ncbi:hypothetical protein HELRODRAFT_161708 [Helobdella robusta]|uniref:Uncharacterized protein n=1 Tax=Helobdella robusta TaxID=6412 RepID=T1ERT3_HELRO|nr:hypothetical protein HELRODRAFT_161708 [Helobdella robusta]ESO02437.1 hypothetical protein HELRODRAFT_161708 [Helobdella robusta]